MRRRDAVRSAAGDVRELRVREIFELLSIARIVVHGGYLRDHTEQGVRHFNALSPSQAWLAQATGADGRDHQIGG